LRADGQTHRQKAHSRFSQFCEPTYKLHRISERVNLNTLFIYLFTYFLTYLVPLVFQTAQ
jgi:hypothetical protein